MPVLNPAIEDLIVVQAHLSRVIFAFEYGGAKLSRTDHQDIVEFIGEVRDQVKIVYMLLDVPE